MRKSYIIPAALAGAVLISGGAIGQTASPETPPDAVRNAPAERMLNQPSGTGAGANTSASLSQDLVGKDVVNADGETIGNIEAIEGDQAVVSVGGFLGIGARQVALSQEQISISGDGADAKISTTLTKEEVRALPVYTAAAPRENMPSGGSGGMDRGSSPAAPESSGSPSGESAPSGSGGSAN